MITPLSYLQKLDYPLPIYRSLLNLTEKLSRTLTNDSPKRILLLESDPLLFLAYFIIYVSNRHQIFLGNPNWKKSELESVIEWIKPHEIIGNIPTLINFNNQLEFNNIQGSLIMIPTGGTSGKIRFVMHNWHTLTASAQGFIDYFEIKKVNSCCVLPLYHVSGLMQFVRSLISGGEFQIISYQEIKAENINIFNPQDYFISLVPTQLQQLLNNPKLTDWLSQFKTILLGGAPAWPDLLKQARQAKLPLSLTYGMTETASQIATLKPNDFLAGMNNCGQVLPHAKIKINEQGVISIKADSLYLGYYPDYIDSLKSFQTDDLGYLDEQEYLTIFGRKSQKIISGGENIFPVEIEAIIRETQLVKDIVILGIPDQYWGEKVVAVYVPMSPEITNSLLQQSILTKLARYKQPKSWISVEKIPRNEPGKINYFALREIVKLRQLD